MGKEKFIRMPSARLKWQRLLCHANHRDEWFPTLRWVLPLTWTLTFSLSLVGMILLSPAAAQDMEKRAALVIGLSTYQNAPLLMHPVPDARAVGESLRRLKFDVTELYDTNYDSLASGIRDFGVKAASADVALVYYAGHAVQIDRINYLLPVDVNLERVRDLLYEAMPLERMLDEVAQARKIGIVLLDSCRSNPFLERLERSMAVAGRTAVTTPGMARVDTVPRNVTVMLAAKADKIADEGSDHSPFAAALLAHFHSPGLELSLFFRSVRDTVLRATNNRQEPYVFSSLGAEPFYFYPRPPNRPPVIAALQRLELLDTAGPTLLGVPQPTDPDQDPLSVRIVGLPNSGEVRVQGRTAVVNGVYSAEQFTEATYNPDGKTLGAVGTVDILIEDGRGGRLRASLPIVVLPSHRPPVVEALRTVRVSSIHLGIEPPTSPDGDAISVVIRDLPRGAVYNGSQPLRTGDRLRPEDLANLTFQPEPGLVGDAGSLRYVAENERGDATEGRLNIEVTPAQISNADFRRRTSEALEAAGNKVGTDEKIHPVSILPPASPLVPAAQILAPPFVSRPAQSPAERANNMRLQDCPMCPRMIQVPGGTFMMGQGATTLEAAPIHRVSIASFVLSEAPITVIQWKACLSANGCSDMPRMRVTDDNTPIHNVSWDDAIRYATWLSQLTNQPYRLPSEAEWEWAARGGTTTRYWWSDVPGVALANCADCGGPQNPTGPLPVYALRPNPFGLYGMLGGVAQWTADCWFPNYVGAPMDGSPREHRSCMKRVLRGGSFRETHDRITVTARANYDASVRYLVNGFRVARSIN